VAQVPALFKPLPPADFADRFRTDVGRPPPRGRFLDPTTPGCLEARYRTAPPPNSARPPTGFRSPPRRADGHMMWLDRVPPGPGGRPPRQMRRAGMTPGKNPSCPRSKGTNELSLGLSPRPPFFSPPFRERSGGDHCPPPEFRSDFRGRAQNNY